MAFTTASRRGLALLCVLAATVLAACSSSAAGELTTTPAVTANGKHYAYDAGSVGKSSWPKVCSLLSTASAAAAIGTAVAAKSFHHRCFYIPGNDAFPTLTVTILGIGSDQRNAYEQVRDDNARRSPTKVHGVGKAAITYELAGSPTVNLDLLAGQGLFEIALRSPVGNKAGASQARTILTKVGRALASEFAG